MPYSVSFYCSPLLSFYVLFLFIIFSLSFPSVHYLLDTDKLSIAHAYLFSSIYSQKAVLHSSKKPVGTGKMAFYLSLLVLDHTQIYKIRCITKQHQNSARLSKLFLFNCSTPKQYSTEDCNDCINDKFTFKWNGANECCCTYYK